MNRITALASHWLRVDTTNGKLPSPVISLRHRTRLLTGASCRQVLDLSLMSVFIQRQAVWVRDLFSIARTGVGCPRKVGKKKVRRWPSCWPVTWTYSIKKTQLASHSGGGETRRPIFNQRPRLVGCCANHWASSNPIFQRTHQMLGFLTKINKRLSFFETSRSSTSRREPSLGQPTKNTKNFQRNT